MKKLYALSCFLLIVTTAPSLLAAEDESHWAVLDQFCNDCHNSEDWAGELSLELFDADSISQEPEVFEKIVRKLRGRMMPPPGQDKPGENDYINLVSWLEGKLDGQPNIIPGYVDMRRLNRTEYQNVIEDLFDLEINAADLLPRDDMSDGFDNIASVLSETPSFVDQYVSAARTVAAMAVGDPAGKAEVSSYYSEGEVNQSRHDSRMPLGTRGGIVADHYFPLDGVYEFKVDGLVTGDYTPGLEYRHKVLLFIDDEEVWSHDVGGDADMREVDQQLAPAIAELNSALQGIMIPVSAGQHKVALTFMARSLVEADDIFYPFTPGGGDSRIMSPRRLEVAGPVEISGIGNTASRQKIFICQPASSSQEAACAEQILGTIAARAFRRPLQTGELDIAMEFYRRGRELADFNLGIRTGLLPILVSPKFLYRAEPPPADLPVGMTFPLDDYALASRLSFFLWSRLPDEELLSLAEQGRLSDSDVMNNQVHRMLADPRAEALVNNFARQWLELQELEGFNPDPLLFPNVDKELRNAAQQEVELFLSHILLGNRNVLELLSSPTSYINERLALHYDIPDVQGDRFREVTLDNPSRHGLLGKAAVLMVTSYPNRTAPVLRGAWILSYLTGTPPANPPPDVEAFPENEAGSPARTVRERLETHRANPNCNGCHGLMDPLGFALENFDAVGRWREKDIDAGELIDSSGELVDGTSVNNPVELSQALKSRPDLLVQTLTEKLMTFALGRRVAYFDMPTVRRIVTQAQENDYRFYSIVEGIVNSEAFRYQTVVDNEQVLAAE